MRELRGAGTVVVRHISGESNPADLFTKIVGRQVFEKHRKYIMNLSGDVPADSNRRGHDKAASSQRYGTGAP